MELGYVIGWVGVSLGAFIGVPQLIRILRTKSTEGISLGTYIILVLAVSCYLIHAISINSIVFTVSNSANLLVSGTILILLIRNRR